MKNAYFLVAAAAFLSSPAFAEREIKCQAVKVEKSMNNIKSVNLTIASHGASKAQVSRLLDGVATAENRDATSSQYWEEDTFQWYESSEVESTSDVYVVAEIDLVKKDRSKGVNASWVLRKTLVKKTGGSYCIPHEDKDCNVTAEVVQESPVVCSDSADVPTGAADSTQQAIDSDPCNPKNW